jgi:DNA polymerase (family 10)
VANPIARELIAAHAENLLALTMPLEQIVAEDRLREIPGVGVAIADIIAEGQGAMGAEAQAAKPG